MRPELLHPADQLVMVMNRIYSYGMTTTSGGNLSIRDADGDIWITPAGIDKGALTAEDIVRVSPDGTVTGKHRPSSELPFHQSVYRHRPQAGAVLHAHSPALVSFCIARKLPQTRLIPDIHLICGEVAMASYAMTGSDDLAEKLVEALQPGVDIVLLQNHGVVSVGGNIFDAFRRFETLEFCAGLQIDACRIGQPVPMPENAMEICKARQNRGAELFAGTLASDGKQDVEQIDEQSGEQYGEQYGEIRRHLCALLHRAYDQKIIIGTQGVFSARLNGDTFVITPGTTDRKYTSPGELVNICGNMRETGKLPDATVLLHRLIYQTNPNIHAVIIARPAAVMAFAVSAEPLCSRIIPESYLMLRDIQRSAFVDITSEPAASMLAGMFSKGTAAVLVENDCIIVTGRSLIEAFDRLEVAEYSAKALIAGYALGGVTAMSDEEISEIDRAFKFHA